MISHRDYFQDVRLQIYEDGELIEEERFPDLLTARNSMLASLPSMIDFQSYESIIRVILRQVHQIGDPSEGKIYEIYAFTKRRGEDDRKRKEEE